MRMPITFIRRKGAGDGVQLGSDAAPTSLPKGRSMPDNQLSMQAFAGSFPVRRIVLGYSPPSGSLALVVNAYVCDETTGRWFRTGAKDVALEANALTTIDLPALIERAPLAHELGLPPAHHVIAAIVVSDPGAAPDGEHIVAVGLAP